MSGKTIHVLITGGGSGIGLAAAKAFAEEGHTVTIAGRSRKKLDKAVKGLPGAQFAVMDVTDEKSVNSAVEGVEKKSGPVRVLVNNAGAAHSAPFAKTAPGAWQAMLDVNLTGTYLVTRACLPGMRKNGGGCIVNIASTAGLKGYPYTSAYVAAKHGVVGLTRALALELARDRITVNAVCPGFTRTKMVENAVKTISKKTGMSEKEALAEIVKFNPQKRLIEPEEVATTVVWLASHAARTVTGQAIAVAGGEVMP